MAKGRRTYVLYRSWNCGEWNITLISDTLMNFPTLMGFQKYIHQSVKSSTYLGLSSR